MARSANPSAVPTASAASGPEPVLVDVQDPHAHRADLQREREHTAGTGLVGRWGVPGPAAEAGTAQVRLQDRPPRVDGVDTGPFAELELQALQPPGVRVGTGDGAADLPRPRPG